MNPYITTKLAINHVFKQTLSNLTSSAKNLNMRH